MKLIILLSRVPYPLEKGDKLRAFYQIKGLSQHHEIYLIALNDSKVHPDAQENLQPFCKEIHILNLTIWTKMLHIFLAFFKKLPIQCGYFYSFAAQKKIDQLIHQIQPDLIYAQMVRVAEYVKHKNIHKVIDFQDVLSKGMKRRAEKESGLYRFFFRFEYKRLLAYEKLLLPLFDRRTIITAVDRNFIDYTPETAIDVIPNGVDFKRFTYHGEEKEYDLIFTGNMSYPPNVIAAEYIVKQIVPQLQEQFPNLKTLICGANPASQVKALANEKGVFVTGWVDNISEYYAKSKIFIAPLTIGTGLQNKLLEAMAMQLPCITSPLAAAPLEIAKEEQNFIICNTQTGFIDAITLLLTDKKNYQEIAQNGHHFVKNNYHWDAANERLNRILMDCL
ncbi:MAG: glycosyltransferase [Bacteroidales bacterium]|jgi:sugar transferase (PEP-CTERM/EpsH1 system associated)|nr:glycosyltransferase [Bacteroidales bacterium]